MYYEMFLLRLRGFNPSFFSYLFQIKEPQDMFVYVFFCYQSNGAENMAGNSSETFTIIILSGVIYFTVV